jgi:hypothetical protein
MVRGYDPASTDLSTLMWNYLFSFWTADRRMSLSESQDYVKYWLKSSHQTSSLYNKFRALSIKPTIRLKMQCDHRILQSDMSLLKEDDKYFPAMTRDGEIIICLSQIENKLQLK